MAAAVGAGATLEALVAALAVRRFVELPFRRPRDALLFAALAGPVPGTIGALTATSALFWAGLVPRERLAMFLGVSWVGEVTGTVVFAPLVWLLGAAAPDWPWRRRLGVALPVIAAAALSIWVFVRAAAWDDGRAQAVLRQRAEAVRSAVRRSLTYHLDALRAFADFAGQDSRIDPAPFQRVATGAVLRHFAYEALAWAPAPLDRRPVVVTLVEPSSARAALPLGLDLAHEAAAAAKLSDARRSGEAWVLPSVTTADARRLWVFVPAPGRNGEQGIQGFFGAALRLDLMIERVITELGREGVVIELREPERGGRTVVRTPANGAPGPYLTLGGEDDSLSVADRAFVLAPLVSASAVAAQRSAEVWVLLLAGMLFVAMLEGVLLVAAAAPRAPVFPFSHPPLRVGPRR